jgi:hypothetical protein
MADANDALGEDHTSFIEFEGMSGFVSDSYLNAIAAETTTTALELEAAGMWERRDGPDE